MQVFSRSTTPTKIETKHGELIYELVGRTLGSGTARHSMALVVIPAGMSSLRHLHPRAEESYYVIEGTGDIEIDAEATSLSAGEVVLIPPGSAHKIYNAGSNDLVLLVVCVPAWEESNTVWLESA